MFENNQPGKKPLIFYIIIAASIIMLLNAFVFPALLQRQVVTVSYSDFLSMTDAGKIKEVQLDQSSNQIIFIAANEDGQDGIYKTAVFPDEGLRERLEAAGVTFSAMIPTQGR